MRRAALSVLLLFAAKSLAQSCDNYGSVNGSQCACPPGFGGATCAEPACGGNYFQAQGRPLAPALSGSLYGNISTCGCQDGWGGTGCNVCTTASACQTAFSASAGSQSAIPGSPLTADQTQNTTLTCSTEARVWASSQMTCSVINPTLQALFPLSSTLNILRTLDPSLVPYPGAADFGAAGSVFAQLWYDGVEQFYCRAGSCEQQAGSDGSSNWKCQGLQCVCRPNTTFCGGIPTNNLTGTINTLSGVLEINCNAPGAGGANCAFKQSILQALFGAQGLSLTGCSFGECVRQSVIDQAVTSGSGNSTAAEQQGNELSGGVIAGLVVVGTLILAALLLLVWGWFVQRKARAAGTGINLAKSGGVGIQWKNITYTIPRVGGTFWRKNQNDDGKVILQGVSGRVEPGQMLAILGPSGAGKSTLIDILGLKQKSGRTTGSVVFFSAATNETVKRPRIGYVDQADVLPANLTVREALLFAARLRLPEAIPDNVKVARVFEVMTQLGIADIADTRIGGSERRGISGGEMRRVSIGLELVARPDVLVLDEPTSGLDSVSAAKVATVLHNLAHDPDNPTAVIASIHQPSSKLYRIFDQVLVLSAGKELYSGRGGIAPAQYFEAQGLPMQEGYNVADHLLDIASDPPNSVLQVHQRGKVPQANPPVEVIDGPQDMHREKPNGLQVGHGSVLPSPSGSVDAVEKARVAALSTPPAETSIPKASSTYATTFLTQLQVLSGREWKNLKRDHTLFLTHFAVAAVLGVFCGGLYFKTGITIAGFQSRVGSLFFLGSLLSFSALSALYNLVEIRPLFLRERSGSYYSPTSWLLSRFVFDIIPLRIIPTLVVSTITYWMAGLSPDAGRFFKFLFILVLYALAMTLFNFLLACLFRNGGIAILLSALFNLFIMTYAGFFVHLADIPPVLRWLQWFSLLKYCLEALAVNEVGSGLMIEDTLQGVPVNVSAQLIMNLLFGFGANNYYRDVLVLFAFIAGFGIALITVVWFNVRERR